MIGLLAIPCDPIHLISNRDDKCSLEIEPKITCFVFSVSCLYLVQHLIVTLPFADIVFNIPTSKIIILKVC